MILNEAGRWSTHTLQIGHPVGLDGENGDSCVHMFWVRNECGGPLTGLRLEEVNDELDAVLYSLDGQNYSNSLNIGDVGVGQVINIHVKIEIPAGTSDGQYFVNTKLTAQNGYEWNLSLYYNVIASKKYLSQERKVKIGSLTLPSGFTSDSESSSFQDNVVESASGNVRAGERYRKKDRRLEFVIADEPSQEKTAIEEILPDGNTIELKKGSANIYVVDNTNGIIYELYPRAHNSSINPNAPKFRRSSVAYHPRDGAQVRHHEPRIVDVERVYDVDDDAADFSEGQLYGVTGASGKLQLALAGAPTFTRNSVAYKSDGTQVGTNQPRFETVNTNLLKDYNVSFETGTFASWYTFAGYGGATYTVTNEKAKHGSYSAKIVTFGGATGEPGIDSQKVDVAPNQSYTIVAWLAGTFPDNKVKLVFRWYDSNNSIIRDDGYYITGLTNDFRRYVFTYTSPSNAVKCSVMVRILTSAVGTVYIDAIQLFLGGDKIEPIEGWTGVWAEEASSNIFPHSKSFEECSGTHVGNPANSNGVPTQIGGGWYVATHYNSATIKVNTDGGLHGSKRVTFVHDGSTGWKGLVSNEYTIEAGKTYTVQVWARANKPSAASFSAGYAFYNQAGQRYNFSWPDGYPTNPKNVGKWVRGVVTFTATATENGRMYLYGLDQGEAGLELDYDCVMIEERGYATSWTDGTRNAEHINGPSSVFNLTEGTIEAWFMANDVDTSRYGGIVTFGASAPGPRLLIMRDRYDASIAVWDGDGVDEVMIDSGVVVVPKTWYYVAYTWSPQGRVLYVNGAQKTTHPRTKPIGTPSTLRIGNWNGGSHLNGVIAMVRISRRARTSQEIADVYATATMTVDKDTTYFLPLTNSFTYGQGGYRIVPVGDLNKVRIVNFSMASWSATTDSNSSVYVDFAVTNDGVSVPNEEQWVRVTSGEAVLPIGTDVNGKYLWRREILLTNNDTSNPSLNNIMVDVQGKLPQGSLIEEGTNNLLTTASSPTAETVSVTTGARYTASAVGGTLTVYQRHITSTTSDWQSGTLTDVEVV